MHFLYLKTKRLRQKKTWNDVFDVKEQQTEYTSHPDTTMVIQFDIKSAEDHEYFSNEIEVSSQVEEDEEIR